MSNPSFSEEPSSLYARKIGRTHAQFIQQMHQNSSDKCVFLKHGEIEDKFSISLDFLRDMNNTLGLLSQE